MHQLSFSKAEGQKRFTERKKVHAFQFLLARGYFASGRRKGMPPAIGCACVCAHGGNKIGPGKGTCNKMRKRAQDIFVDSMTNANATPAIQTKCQCSQCQLTICYQYQVPPQLSAIQDICHLRHLPSKTFVTVSQDIWCPRQLLHKTMATRDICHPRQWSPKTFAT